MEQNILHQNNEMSWTLVLYLQGFSNNGQCVLAVLYQATSNYFGQYNIIYYATMISEYK